MIHRPGGVLMALALVVALAGGCGAGAGASAEGASASPGTGTVPLTILAAASLKDALGRAKDRYAAAMPGVALTLGLDSSSALRAQIEQGAPADVFLSADTRNPDTLVAEGIAAGPPIAFATNSLTVIVPRDNPAKIASPADLARPGVKIIAAGDAVPITTYANGAVGKLAALPGYPPRFAAGYAANVASREDNVNAVVAKVELGEGDAAIVYVTDARASAKVQTIPIPPAANPSATYAGVVVRSSAHPDAARAFLAWLAGPAGRAVLSGFGFGPPA